MYIFKYETDTLGFPSIEFKLDRDVDVHSINDAFSLGDYCDDKI